MQAEAAAEAKLGGIQTFALERVVATLKELQSERGVLSMGL